MKSRKLVIGLLIMLAFVVSSFTFAYWAGAVTGLEQDTPGTVSIGQGGTSTVVLAFDEATNNGDLTPTAYAGPDTSELTFNVVWSEDTLNTASGTGSIGVTIESFSLGTLSEAQIEDMFNISITAGNDASITMNGLPVQITITVIFENEPATQAIYDQVANGELSITVGIELTVDTE